MKIDGTKPRVSAYLQIPNEFRKSFLCVYTYCKFFNIRHTMHDFIFFNPLLSGFDPLLSRHANHVPQMKSFLPCYLPHLPPIIHHSTSSFPLSLPLISHPSFSLLFTFPFLSHPFSLLFLSLTPFFPLPLSSSYFPLFPG